MALMRGKMVEHSSQSNLSRLLRSRRRGKPGASLAKSEHVAGVGCLASVESCQCRHCWFFPSSLFHPLSLHVCGRAALTVLAGGGRHVCLLPCCELCVCASSSARAQHLPLSSYPQHKIPWICNSECGRELGNARAHPACGRPLSVTFFALARRDCGPVRAQRAGQRAAKASAGGEWLMLRTLSSPLAPRRPDPARSPHSHVWVSAGRETLVGHRLVIRLSATCALSVAV
jgi:hypothetical protein